MGGGGSPGPQPRGKLRGSGPGPQPRGKLRGIWPGGVVVWRPSPVTATAAGGTHTTGLHSCIFYFTTTQLQPKRKVAQTASPWFPFFWTYKIPRFFQYFFQYFFLT